VIVTDAGRFKKSGSTGGAVAEERGTVGQDELLQHHRLEIDHEKPAAPQVHAIEVVVAARRVGERGRCATTRPGHPGRPRRSAAPTPPWRCASTSPRPRTRHDVVEVRAVGRDRVLGDGDLEAVGEPAAGGGLDAHVRLQPGHDQAGHAKVAQQRIDPGEVEQAVRRVVQHHIPGLRGDGIHDLTCPLLRRRPSRGQPLGPVSAQPGVARIDHACLDRAVHAAGVDHRDVLGTCGGEQLRAGGDGLVQPPDRRPPNASRAPNGQRPPLAVAAVTAFAEWLGLRDGTFPGDRALLVTTAYGVMLPGTASVHLAAPRLPPRLQAIRLRSRRGIVGFVCGVAAVALATGAVVASARDRSRVDATTTAAVPPPPTPTDLTQVAWRWSEGEEIFAAVPAGAGVVVSTSHGVVALDGRTGQERWHCRRDDARAADLAAVDGGRGVIASIGCRLHAFDAFTGELRWRTEPPTARVSPAWSYRIDATDSTVIRTQAGYGDTNRVEYELAGTDATTGEPTWRYSRHRGVRGNRPTSSPTWSSSCWTTVPRPIRPRSSLWTGRADSRPGASWSTSTSTTRRSGMA
jgi:hypothetical protein